MCELPDFTREQRKKLMKDLDVYIDMRVKDEVQKLQSRDTSHYCPECGKKR